MKLLLDTHVFLWFISGDKRLSDDLQRNIRNADNDVFLSVVSVWEATIKQQLRKLSLPEPAGLYLPKQRERHRIESLPVDEGSVARLAGLPDHHRDPFDRMLICQAEQHGLTIATSDAAIRSYPVAVMDGS